MKAIIPNIISLRLPIDGAAIIIYCSTGSWFQL